MDQGNFSLARPYRYDTAVREVAGADTVASVTCRLMLRSGQLGRRPCRRAWDELSAFLPFTVLGGAVLCEQGLGLTLF